MNRFFQSDLAAVQDKLRFQTFTVAMLKAHNYKPSAILQTQLLALYKARVLRAAKDAELNRLLQTEEIVEFVPRKDDIVMLRYSSGHTLTLQLVKTRQLANTGIPFRFYIQAVVFDPSPCKLDVSRMLEKLKQTRLPNKVKTILMDRLDDASVDPDRVCQDLTNNVQALLGPKFTSDGWTVVQFLGAGAFGVTVGVRRVVREKPESRALKIVAENSYATFANELNMHVKMADLDLAPKVYADMMYEGGRYKKRVVLAYGMQRIDMIARDFLSAAQPGQQMRLFSKYLIDILKRLKRNNITHGDLHTENLAIQDGRLQLIDFGWSSNTQAWVLYDYVQLFRTMMMDFLDDLEKCVQTIESTGASVCEWVCGNHWRMVNRMKLLFESVATEFRKKEDRNFYYAFGPIFDELQALAKKLKQNTRHDVWNAKKRKSQIRKLQHAVAVAFDLLHEFHDELFIEYSAMNNNNKNVKK